MINKISHYAIPKSCNPSGSGCPLHDIDLSALMPKAYENRYDEVTLTEAEVYLDDITNSFTPQGACTDGTYLYRAMVSSDEAPTKLQKIELASGNLVLETTTTSFGHANDMTYAKGYLYIAHSSSTSILYKVDPETFALVDTINLPLTIWGISYCAENDLFILGSVGSGYLSVYYPDFSFMYRIKPVNPFYGLVRQGIHCDSNYIYVSLDNAYGTVLGNDMGSRIMVYTWNGIFVKSIYVPIKEIEWAFELSGYLYIGTYEGRDENDTKSGKVYKVAYDLYPEQTVLTGRPTEVSGGINNLQRLPEGTPIRLWSGSVTSGSLTLDSNAHNVKVSEDSPFRYLRFRFKGANQQVFDWYPTNDGVPCLREIDITNAESDSNIRIREMRLSFNVSSQTFTVDSNFFEQILSDVSEGTIKITKHKDNTTADLIELTQIWGVI